METGLFLGIRDLFNKQRGSMTMWVTSTAHLGAKIQEKVKLHFEKWMRDTN